VTLCCWVGSFQCCEGLYFLYLHEEGIAILKAMGTTDPTTQYHIPEHFEPSVFAVRTSNLKYKLLVSAASFLDRAMMLRGREFLFSKLESQVFYLFHCWVYGISNVYKPYWLACSLWPQQQ
jgi:hypothetical protein